MSFGMHFLFWTLSTKILLMNEKMSKTLKVHVSKLVLTKFLKESEWQSQEKDGE